MSVTERSTGISAENYGVASAIPAEYPEIVHKNGEAHVVLGFVDMQVTQDTSRREEIDDIVTRMRCFGIPMGVYSDSPDVLSAIESASAMGANGFVIAERGKKIVTIFEKEHMLNEGVASSLDFPDGLPTPKMGDEHAFTYLTKEVSAYFPSVDASGIVPILITGEESTERDHELHPYGGRAFPLSENTLSEIGIWMHEAAVEDE